MSGPTPTSRPAASRVGRRELAGLLDGWAAAHPGPGYRALAERLRLLVLDGRVPVPAVLPSERELAELTGTSRTTATAAYRWLRDEGFARAGQGSGTWTALPHGAAVSDAALAVPWPVTTSGSRGTADGRGDLSSAAPEAPAQVHAAYAAALAELPRYLPGHGYVTAGLPELRARIAQRYTARGLHTVAEQILVTAGAMHGLRLVLDAVLHKADRVLVEQPTYPLALDAVRRAGGRPVALDVIGGWSAELADEVLRSSGARWAYLMPDFQNPTGRLLDADGRDELARVLARHGCTAVIDETTADLDLRPPGTAVAPQPFPAWAPDAICLGSASKTFWGGLRIGWVRTTPALVHQLTLSRAGDDLGSPLVEQLATAHLLDQVDAVLAERRATLRRRRDALAHALAEHLPQWSAPVPDGGMVLWCALPEPRSSALAGAARELGVTLTPGPRFAVSGRGFEDRVRLPFARPQTELRAAVALLAAAWHGAPQPIPGEPAGGRGSREPRDPGTRRPENVVL